MAETLCTAKNTSVSGMVQAGILAAKGGKVRLLKQAELDPQWDPATDQRLTVWEATHHLIRSLDSGEAVAPRAEKTRCVGGSRPRPELPPLYRLRAPQVVARSHRLQRAGVELARFETSGR